MAAGLSVNTPAPPGDEELRPYRDWPICQSDVWRIPMVSVFGTVIFQLIKKTLSYLLITQVLSPAHIF